MGSSESKPNSPSQQQAQEQARIRADEENLLRQKARLEEEKIQWQQQQIREQRWKEIQLREEQKQKETMLQWQQRDKLKMLREELLLQSEKQKLQDQEKERLQNVQLENQKLQEQLEKERLQNAQLEIQKLQEQLEKERLQNVQLEKEKLHNAQLEETRLLLQQLRVHQQQQVCAATAPAVTPLASSGMRETVALQQKASPCTAASPSSSIASRQTIAAQQKSLSAAQPIVKNLPKSKETPKSYLMRMNESNVKCNEWSIIDYIKDENFISKQVSENLFKLFCDNNTIPFITRYRRHLTQGMNEDKLRKARHSYDQAKLIKQRAIIIVKDIDNKGRWTPEFHALVHETKSLDDLEYIHSIFNTNSEIKQIATKNGLGIVADNCLKRKTPPIAHLVQESVEGLKTQEQVKDGIICLLVDIIIKDRRTYKIIKELRLTHQFEIQTVKGKEADELKKHENIYEPYYNFTLSEHGLKPDQVRDINKGEALKALSVKVIIPKEFECEFKKQCLQQYGFLGYPPSAQKTLVDAAVNFAYIGSIKGSVAKRVRKEISDKAAFAAVDHLAKKLASYMLAPPVRGKVVIGINPGFQNGCKFAVVSEQGYVLDTGTIYPNNANNPKDKHEAERVLVKMICKHKCKIIAMGNGTASKETTVFLTYIIKKNKKIPSDVFFTIVDQSSTSIYSCSREAALEFPGVKNEIASAVSIARRLQDPMAELIKIEAEQLMVEKQHQEVYQQLIVEMVSYVGVDVNTASLALLKRVAGLDEAKANSIIEWRKSSGPFTNRNDLLNVKGINKSIFEQCAGFIRILPETAVATGGHTVSQDSFNYLDQTWIHPESYDIAKSFLEAANCNVLQLGTSNFIFTVNLYARTGYSILAKRFGTSEETIEMIVQGLRIEKGQDIRGKEDSTMFCRSLIRFNDLNNGVLLTGVVTRLAEFGAFVDVNAEIDGLIHKSCMNGLTVKADQKVEVRVSNIQKERGRLGLTLVRCV